MTKLGTGEDVTKSATRLDAYGTVDELSCVIGMLRDNVASLANQDLATLPDELLFIQRDLFALSSELAFPSSDPHVAGKFRIISAAHAARLEKSMDRMTAVLPPLKHFIIPGGNPVASQAQVARTVCRRMERELVRLHHEHPVRADCLMYANRLSDWLFTTARFILNRAGGTETRA